LATFAPLTLMGLGGILVGAFDNGLFLGGEALQQAWGKGGGSRHQEALS
jgi:hypothetical protein